MKLCQTKALGVLYHHDGGIRHVQPNLYNGSGDQRSNLSARLTTHSIDFLLGRHAAVQQAHFKR